MLGVGTDILSINRIKAILEHDSGSFVGRTFTVREQKAADQRNDSVLFYATRFAGKEAIFKCLDLDPESIDLKEIEILNSPSGRPEVFFKGNLRKVLQQKGIKKVDLSLSYENDYVLAFAMSWE